MKRALTLFVVVAAGALALAQPVAAAPPAKPCDLLERSEVKELLLGKRVVKVERETQGDIAACTWRTRYYQTPHFKKAKAAFSLELSVQPTSGIEADLDELRSRSADIDEISVDKVTGIGDEAYRNFGDLIVVVGDITIQVGAHNYDTSKPPKPDIDAIADNAAKLAIDRL